MLMKGKGLTLVEIVVAMAVFAIIVVSFLPAFLFVAQLNVVSKAGVDTTAVAQKEAERFYSYSRSTTYTAGIKGKTVLTFVEGSNTLTYDLTEINDVMTLRRETAEYKVTITLSTLSNEQPQCGMVKFRAEVELVKNYQNALAEQIDTILLFKQESCVAS